MTHFKPVFLQLLFITFIVLSIASCDKRTSKDTSDPNDTLFFGKAAVINLEEIELGKLAEQKSKMTDIKNLGKMMQEDHSKLMESLTALAKEKSIMLPSLDKAEWDDYQTLNTISGMGFDKKYCDMMANGHKGAIAIFEKDSADTKDADVRQWVIAAIPVLPKHLSYSMMCRKKYDRLN